MMHVRVFRLLVCGWQHSASDCWWLHSVAHSQAQRLYHTPARVELFQLACIFRPRVCSLRMLHLG